MNNHTRCYLAFAGIFILSFFLGALFPIDIVSRHSQSTSSPEIAANRIIREVKEKGVQSIKIDRNRKALLETGQFSCSDKIQPEDCREQLDILVSDSYLHATLKKISENSIAIIILFPDEARYPTEIRDNKLFLRRIDNDIDLLRIRARLNKKI